MRVKNREMSLLQKLERQSRIVSLANTISFLILAVVTLAFWGGLGFIAWHFITKFW
jgi:nitrate reductase NapE component